MTRRAKTVDLGKPKRPKSERRGCALVIIHPEGPLHGKRFDVDAHGALLGRAQGIVLGCEGVSRAHAKIHLAGSDWIVEDLRSTNGTFVNERRVERQILEDGDLLRLGTVILQFLTGPEIEEHYQETIHRLVVEDPVTGMPTRRAFLEFLEREASRSKRHHTALSLVLIDVDHFDPLQKTYGKMGADAILREIGRRFVPRARKEDLVARCGPHEFACVLTGTPLPGALAFARALQLLVSDVPFTVDDHTISLTVSIGVTSAAGRDGKAVGEIVAAASERLYAARKGGRNRVES